MVLRRRLLVPAVLLLVGWAAGCGETRERSSCGNGLLDPEELCDQDQLAGASCESEGLGSGALKCKSSCKEHDRSGCSGPLSCGDGLIQAPEVCDGTNVGPVSCASLGRGEGALACTFNCLGLVTSGCAQADAGLPLDAESVDRGTVDGGSPDDATTTDLGPVGDAGPGNSPPMFGAIGPNPLALTEGQQLTLEVQVTDPDGSADLLSVNLRAPAGTLIGPLAATSPTTFAIALNWTSMLALGPGDFSGSTTVNLRVEALDRAGHQVDRVLPLRLHCDGTPSGGACNGTCTPLDTPGDCGACGASCVISGYGQCVRPGVCGGYERSSTTVSCDDTCASTVSGTCIGATVGRYHGGTSPASCGFVPNLSPFISVQVVDQYCDCYGRYERTPGQTCVPVCYAANVSCAFSEETGLHLEWVPVGGGAQLGKTFECEWNYDPWINGMPDITGVAVGDIVNLPQYETLTCACEAPPR
ncbi:MAG: hypothetical protein IPG45_17390 [Deltaproteobacteria bacterium]|nr:hypothetical protein [Deltaproteobacteria bacterium]